MWSIIAVEHLKLMTEQSICFAPTLLLSFDNHSSSVKLEERMLIQSQVNSTQTAKDSTFLSSRFIMLRKQVMVHTKSVKFDIRNTVYLTDSDRVTQYKHGLFQVSFCEDLTFARQAFSINRDSIPIYASYIYDATRFDIFNYVLSQQTQRDGFSSCKQFITWSPCNIYYVFTGGL